MQKLIITLVFSLALGSIWAQVQNGLVRVQNSGKTPLANVQIIFSEAVPTTSDQSGRFRLAFSGRKPGDLIFFQEIVKKDYEIVNEKELQVLKIGNSDNLNKDIILAVSGQLNAAKKEYYGISDQALQTSFSKEKNALQEKLKNVQLTQQEYLDKFNALSEQYEQQQKALDNLADIFARTNFDDVSEEYKTAFELFETGKIDEALKILESANLLGRTAKRLNEKKRIEAAATKIAQQKEQNEQEIREDLQGLQLQAQLYVLTFQIEKAEGLYDQVLRLDSTDLIVLQDVTDFYRENHRYDKALYWLPKIVNHPQVTGWQKANANIDLGEVHTATGGLEPALKSYQSAQKAYAEMLSASPSRSFYKTNLATTYSKLGETFAAIGNLDDALQQYIEDARLSKELCEMYPKDIDFKNNLAISYQKLGSTYTSLGDLDAALEFFLLYNKLAGKLYGAYPLNPKFKNSVAVSCSKLGSTYTSLGNLDKALAYYEAGTTLLEQLCESYPINVDFKQVLALSYSQLGSVYTGLDDLETALEYIQWFNNLSKELYESYPKNVDFKKGLALSYAQIGETQTDLGNLAAALTHYEMGNKLLDELYKSYPQNVSFKHALANSYGQIGETHTELGDLDKALKYFQMDNDLLRELHEFDPKDVLIKNDLATSYSRLGSTYKALGNLNKALAFYEKDLKLSKELYEAAPQNVDFKNGLATSCSKMGLTNIALGNLDAALKHIQQYNQLKKELYEAYPQNVPFKNDLALSYARLGSFCQDNLMDKTKAKASFQQAEKLWSELVRDNPQYEDYQRFLEKVQGALKDLDK